MKNILVTGGTGTLGRALIHELYKTSGNSITVFSRDENKQRAMAKKYPKVKYFIGDITNRRDIRDLAEEDIFDHVYHCAALKHIDICEEFVRKCVDTNYQGTVNLYDEIGKDCSCFTFFTTDKAVAPINAYGHAKALSEHYLAQYKNTQIFRWGNIIGSTGSFLPHLVECCIKDERVDITNPIMTRFWIYIEDAVRFVLKHKAPFRGIMYPDDMKSSTIRVLVEAVELLMGKKIARREVDIRPGERNHEAMGADYRGVWKWSSENVLTKEELAIHLEPWVKKYLKERK